MEKKYALCREVLSRFQEAGIVRELIIVGSSCIYFYRDYFADIGCRNLAGLHGYRESARMLCEEGIG